MLRRARSRSSEDAFSHLNSLQTVWVLPPSALRMKVVTSKLKRSNSQGNRPSLEIRTWLCCPKKQSENREISRAIWKIPWTKTSLSNVSTLSSKIDIFNFSNPK